MAELSLELTGVQFPNPTMLASGILGVTRDSLSYVMQHGAGGAVIKSISKEERNGHPGPNLVAYEGGMLNAVGYSNPGAENAREEFHSLRDLPGPAIASIIGTEAKDFVAVAETLLPGEFAAVEVPLSCPHTPGFGTMAGQQSPEATKEITKAVKGSTDLPVWIKLSPESSELGKVAEAAQKGGADAITAVNTMGPGMIIDVATAVPVVGFGRGGVSGAALRPIAVQAVYDIAEAVDIPIIGCGGVETGRDALEMILAGASAVQVGTAVLHRGVDAFTNITDELQDLMDTHGYASVRDAVGKAHPNR